MLTVVEEFGVLSGPLAPVIETFDEQSVTVLEFYDLLKFNWHLLDIEEEVEALEGEDGEATDSEAENEDSGESSEESEKQGD